MSNWKSRMEYKKTAHNMYNRHVVDSDYVRIHSGIANVIQTEKFAYFNP